MAFALLQKLLFNIPSCKKMTVAPQRRNCHIVHETASEVTVASTNTNSNEVSHPASETLSSFLAETSLHGVRFMFTGNIFRSSFWALALLTCFGICSHQVYNSVSIFYLRPFNTKITRKMVRSNIEKVSFPAVTICNFNYINKRWVKYLLKSRENFTKEEIELKLAVYKRIIAGSIRDTFTEKTMERHPELFLRFHGSKKDLRQNYSQMLFGYRLEDVLLPSSVFDSCVFDGETCGSKNFTAFLTSMYSQCYTFNSGYEDHPIILATAPGYLNGLRLLLNVERDNYLYNPSNSLVGFRVLVHDQHTFPVLAQFGFAVRPGVRTLCALKKKKVCSRVYIATCSSRSRCAIPSSSHFAGVKGICHCLGVAFLLYVSQSGFRDVLLLCPSILFYFYHMKWVAER